MCIRGTVFRLCVPLRDCSLGAFAGTRRAPAPCGNETDTERPRTFGVVSVVLARALTIVKPDLENRQTRHWEQAVGVFKLLL